MNDNKFDKAVQQCKELLEKRANIELKIARIALDVCYIKSGGARGSRFTLKNFAHEVGINHTTLIGWVRELRVKEKLPEDVRNSTSRVILRDIMKRTKTKTPNEEEVLSAYAETMARRSTPEDVQAMNYASKLSNISFHINHCWVLDMMQQDNIDEILMHCKEIVNGIEDSRSGDTSGQRKIDKAIKQARRIA